MPEVSAPIVGTLVSVDRYHYVVVRTPDDRYETWLLTEHDRERARTRADKFDRPLPMASDMPGWKRTVLRVLGIR